MAHPSVQTQLRGLWAASRPLSVGHSALGCRTTHTAHRRTLVYRINELINFTKGENESQSIQATIWSCYWCSHVPDLQPTTYDHNIRSVVQHRTEGGQDLRVFHVTFRKLLQSIYSWWVQTCEFTHLVSVAWAESCRYHGSHALVESQSGQPGNFGTEWGVGSHWLWGTASPRRRCGDEGSEHTNTSIQNSFTEFNWSAFGQLFKNEWSGIYLKKKKLK